MRKKLGYLFLSLASCLFAINSINVEAKGATNELNEIFDYKEFLSKDYAKLNGNYYQGKTFKVGTIGHRQVVKFGKTELKCYEIEPLTDTYAIGTIDSLNFKQNFTYNVKNQYTLTAQTSVGIKEIASTAIKFEDTSNIVLSTEYTTSYQIGAEIMYSTNLTKSYEISGSYNLNSIPNDKKAFRVSKVACYLEANVEESYEEKEWWWNWWKIDNTISKNYSVDYYITDLITFVYNDNTFGNTEIGTYDIKTIKNY